MGLASLPHPVEARVQSDFELSEKQDENSSFEMIPIAIEAILPDLVILHQCSCVLCAMSFDHPIVTSLDVQDLMHDLRLAATTVTQKMLPPPPPPPPPPGNSRWEMMQDPAWTLKLLRRVDEKKKVSHSIDVNTPVCADHP